MLSNPNINLSRWNHDLAIFRSHFRNSNVGIEKDAIWIQGDLTIEAETGREIGPFTLKIVFPDNYYKGKVSPSTYLLSHRNIWKPLGDAHIEKDWKLCLFLYFESCIDFNQYESFSKYLGSLSSFMLDLWLYQEEVKKVGLNNAVWRGPQRSHNTKGLVEGLIANIKNFQSPCPCGSKKRFHQCCQKIVDKYVYKEIQNV